MKRDYSVSLTRVVATLFIIICHLGSYFGSVVVGQLFNVGVPIFFMISGYLYSEKKIEKTGDFLFKRYIRLEIPALIWLVIICVSALLRKAKLPALHEVVFLLLNLEGLNFIFSKIQDLFIGPWFFTNIMMCYVFFVLFLRIEEKHPKVNDYLTKWGGIVPLLVFCILGLLRVSVAGQLGFFMGVALKRRHLLDRPAKNRIIVYVLYAVLAVGVRIITKRWIDGTVYYDEIIVPMTHVILAATIFAGIKWMFAITPTIMEKITASKVVQHLDRISVYVYISHDMFFSGVVMSVFEWSLPIYASMPIFACLVVTFGTILWLLGDFITRQIDRAKAWLVG